MTISALYPALAILPVVSLLVGILGFKWSVTRVGAISWILALFIAYTFFGAGTRLLLFANCKGLSMSIYVILIIWSSIFLYNIADSAGAVYIVGRRIQGVSDDKLTQFILFAWCFTSLLQGVSGFGVPVAVVAPIMTAVGFDTLASVVACLIGHSWAISFGTMASSYITIQLVTKIPGEVIGPCMAGMFSIAIFATGFEIAYIHGGRGALRKGFAQIILTGLAMSLTLRFMNLIGTAQLATVAAAGAGCAVISLRSYLIRTTKDNPLTHSRHAEQPSESMGFHTAASPYYALILISVVSQLPTVKPYLSKYYFALSFPEVQTSMGYVVAAAENYSKIHLFSHPAPILFVSAILGYLVYTHIGQCDRGILRRAAEKTVGSCIPTSIGIMNMVMMALVMNDSGMSSTIARSAASAFGGFYPLVSPFIGALGTFITGSNTNSNIMFGALQYETAVMLGINAVIIASAQSIGGSIGVAMSPPTIMMGAINAGLSGRESLILAQTLYFCLLNILLIGIYALIAA